MKLLLKVGRRFTFDQNAQTDPVSRGFISFAFWISMVGLCLGVTALLVVTSVVNGFESELKSVLTAFHSHVLFFSQGETISDPQQMQQELKQGFPQIEAVSPYIFTEAMLSSAQGIAGAVLEGIDLATVSEVTAVHQKIRLGRLPGKNQSPEALAEIALGEEVARKLHVKVNDEVILTLPFAEKGDLPKVQKLKVVGILKFGMFEYDNKYALLELSGLQELLNLKDSVNAFKIRTRDQMKSIQLTQALNERYAFPLKARDWSSLNKNLFYAIQLEKAVIATILMGIVLVASFNVVSTILMLVNEKKRQIAMLKTMGWSDWKTFHLFLLISLMMAFIGVIGGVAFAGVLCLLLKQKSIIDLPSQIYFFTQIPVQVRLMEWAWICIVVLCLALLSTLIPSYRLSRKTALEGLRHES